VSDSGYLFDNRVVEAGDRVAALSALFDPTTFRHVDALGIAPGWRCWEVGAGGPSVPRGLATRVGPWAGPSRSAGTTSVAIRRRRDRSIWCTRGWCWSTCQIASGR
jgi:hypothetical protein